MKKVISTLLAILMLLPAVASLAFAKDAISLNSVEQLSEETHEGTNIASQSTLNYFSITATGEKTYVDVDKTTSKVNYNKVVDGDKTTGTNTGYTNIYAFELAFAQAFYFTDIVIHFNGDGTLPGGGATQNNTSLDLITIKMYKAGEEVLSEEVSTLDLTSVSVEANLAADKIEIYRDQSNIQTSMRGKDFFREIETFSEDREFCNVVKSNIASEAVVTAGGTEPGDFCDTWWAWEPKALTDGKKDVGTRSPKGWHYSIFIDFTKDYLISELVLTLNGKGELLNSGSVSDVAMNISQIRVKLFNLDGEQVYDSKDVSVDSTEVKLDPFVEACKIKIEIGNGRGEGTEYLWEVETYVEEGSHIFEETGTSNPTCNRPGYIEYSCHCGKVIKKSVPATGFHQWDEGVVTTPATATDNGVITKTCYACQETKEFDIPATGHNWDAGVFKAPDCINDGYTIYTCQDDGCDATYTTDVISAYGHDWNDGVVTKKASVKEYGEKTYTCLREGCGVVEARQTRKLQYTDSTFEFKFDESNSDYVVDYEENPTDGTTYDDSKNAMYVLQDPAGLLDGDPTTYWHGPTGSTYTITLDREYVFTKGTLWASGNSVHVKIEWIAEDGTVSATYTTRWNTINNGCDKNNPVGVGLDDALAGGAKAKTILITLTGAKWANGAALTLHDLDFHAHKCEVDKSDYILSGSSYVAPTCGTDGSCLAKCPVCESTLPVVLPSDEYGHNVPNPTPDVEPTCSSSGYGHGTCTKCSETIQNVEIPAVGKHVYDEEIVYMEAKCGSIGIMQTVCAGCGRVGSQSPIPATEEHTPEWVEDYCATYTAEGKEVFICTGCGLTHKDNGISERVLPKKELLDDFITFIDFSVRTTDFAGIRVTYKIDLEKLAEIEYECDVRVITTVKNSSGVEKTIESYGKYSDDLYDAETGEFSVVIKPSSYYEEYEVSTVVRLMNFRGVEYYDIDLGELSTDANGKISLCEVAEYVLATNNDLGNNERAFYEKIVAGK